MERVDGCVKYLLISYEGEGTYKGKFFDCEVRILVNYVVSDIIERITEIWLFYFIL